MPIAVAVVRTPTDGDSPRNEMRFEFGSNEASTLKFATELMLLTIVFTIAN